MRPGLLAIGAAFAVVGAGVIAAVTYPGDDPLGSRTGTVVIDDLTPGTWQLVPLPAEPSSFASLSFTWYSTEPVHLDWYVATTQPGCTQYTFYGICPVKPQLAEWSNNVTGHWAESGDSSSMYCLWISTATNTSATVSATLSESYAMGPLPLPMWPLAWAIAGGSLLLGVGGVALYLGLFLPSGVYRTDGEFEPGGDASLDPIDEDGPGPPSGG
jgi:hypothetical protein